jgi:hypothetical protein
MNLLIDWSSFDGTGEIQFIANFSLEHVSNNFMFIQLIN